MSLVAYGSSDESSDEENSDVTNVAPDKEVTKRQENVTQRTTTKLCLPIPKQDIITSNDEQNNINDVPDSDEELPDKIHFSALPKPKNINSNFTNIIEDDDIPPKKEVGPLSDKPVKKDRAPVKITVPSLSEFKDLDEENESKHNKITASTKGTGLFALLPPPKGSSGETKVSKPLIPTVLKNSRENASSGPNQSPSMKKQTVNIKTSTKPTITHNVLGVSSYDSNSEDEDDATTNSTKESSTDFFALTATEDLTNSDTIASSEYDLLPMDASVSSPSSHGQPVDDISTVDSTQNPSKTLVSNIINLPREEIILKNKAEVGPKLPLPEQEYNVDSEGNVAFDEKAIEYLCGKRGVKRKEQVIDESNIIEINGEDIKPDEREWLVKALTEEPIQRPISMQSGGVSSQSKKKHQITYLAHQAKAMEMELKNQWAQNRMTRKQTQSKYGF